jgi:hypothetical protein
LFLQKRIFPPVEGEALLNQHVSTNRAACLGVSECIKTGLFPYWNLPPQLAAGCDYVYTIINQQVKSKPIV